MINILNTYTVESAIFYKAIWGILVGFILCIFTIAAFKDRNTSNGLKALLGIITPLVLLFSISVLITSPRITYYEVSITDDMNFKDFNSKYEIVSQRGEIYTIILKEEQ